MVGIPLEFHSEELGSTPNIRSSFYYTNIVKFSIIHIVIENNEHRLRFKI